MRKQSYILIFLLLTMVMLVSCNNHRDLDRFDEEAFMHETERHHLYRHSPGAKIERLWRSRAQAARERKKSDSPPKPPPEREKMYFYGQYQKLQPFVHSSPEASDSYSILSISWKDSEPRLRFYNQITGSRKLRITCPISSHNSRKVGHDNERNIDFLEVFVSLRRSSVCPWLTRADYDIYKISVSHFLDTDAWEITDMAELTDNRLENTQLLLTPDKKHLVFVEIQNNVPNIRIVRCNGTGNELLVKNASLPFFMDSGEMIYVRKSGYLRDFFIYNLSTRKERSATDEEITQTLNMLPYTKLKARYLLLAHFARLPKSLPLHDIASRKMTFREMTFYALRNSPAILRDYYTMQELMAVTVENVYDIGPDVWLGGYYLTKNNILFPPSPYGVVGDHISQDNFFRIFNGLNIPIVPNVPLRIARYHRDRWDAMAAKWQLQKTVNETIAELMEAYFDYVERDICLARYRQIINLARERLRRAKFQNYCGATREESVLFAENLLAGAVSEYNNAVELLIASQYKLAQLMGLNMSGTLHVEHPDIEILEKGISDLPRLEYFQSQGMLNHPDILRLRAMILRASAERDMGPPSTRLDSVKLEIAYGFGIDQWSKVVNDFLRLSTSYFYPLRLPAVWRAYYDTWKARADSYTQERIRVMAMVKYDIHEAYRDLNVLQYKLKARKSRYEFFRERVRLGLVYEKLGQLEFQQAQIKNLLVNDIEKVFQNKMDMELDAIKVCKMTCGLFRNYTKIYTASGIGLRALPMLVERSLEKVKKTDPQNCALYLWRSLEVANDHDLRHEFFDLCKKRHINKVYCFLSRDKQKKMYLERYDLEFQYFLKKCEDKNIRVYALMGSNEWLDEDFKEEITELLDQLKKFNDYCVDSGVSPFQGIKLDIEPHSLPGWKDPAGRRQLCSQYLDAIDYVRKSTDLPVCVDVPYTYNNISLAGSRNDFLGAILKRVDGVSFMAYLNREDLILRKMLPIIARSDLTVPFEVALETAPVPDAPPYVSFYGQNFEQFYDIYLNCRKFFECRNNFDGLVIHDFTGIKQMNRK